jgi:succinyl-diaminopimelate desuccinylase
VPADPLAIARDLLRCPSVTPAEGGALTFLENVLKKAGFTVHRMTFREPGTDDVENLYARIGTAAPNLVIAGHTDVVPAGDEKAWKHPPFSGEVANGELYGRGAVDMKGGIACAVAAVLDHLGQRGGKPKGSISFLITGDEEGIAVNGTPKLLKWAAERGEKFDHCILAEPSNQDELGDTIKIGRRGSLNGHLIVSGTQGHVAYPQRANIPIRGLVNLIPDEARARFNIRFNDNHTLDSLKRLIEQRAAKAAGGKTKFTFQWEPSNAGVFVTKPGPFTDLVAAAVAETTGRKPGLSTTGGTSDARFITHHCPVVEFGLVGQTMHQINERVPVAHLQKLTGIYRTIIDRYFA